MGKPTLKYEGYSMYTPLWDNNSLYEVSKLGVFDQWQSRDIMFIHQVHKYVYLSLLKWKVQLAPPVCKSKWEKDVTVISGEQWDSILQSVSILSLSKARWFLQLYDIHRSGHNAHLCICISMDLQILHFVPDVSEMLGMWYTCSGTVPNYLAIGRILLT